MILLHDALFCLWNKRLFCAPVHRLSYVWLVLLLLGGCNYPGSKGPVWLDEPIVTSGISLDEEPVDEVRVFDYGVTKAYCFMTLHGPENVKLFVRWYFEDQLVIEQFVDFGQERKAAPFLDYGAGQPLPPGKYRCEFGVVAEKPLRVANFRVASPESSQ